LLLQTAAATASDAVDDDHALDDVHPDDCIELTGSARLQRVLNSLGGW
jgi:hypothetical protein